MMEGASNIGCDWMGALSTVERANEEANILFGTVDVLFDTVDNEGTGNEEGKEHFAPPDAPAAVDGLSG